MLLQGGDVPTSNANAAADVDDAKARLELEQAIEVCLIRMKATNSTAMNLWELQRAVLEVLPVVSAVRDYAAGRFETVFHDMVRRELLIIEDNGRVGITSAGRVNRLQTERAMPASSG